MKAINYVTVIALFILGSCASNLYTGVEYDDLYFQPSDRVAMAKVKKPVQKQVTEGNLKTEDYYDNIYASDTLISDEYSEALNSENVIVNNYNRGYYDNYDYSYSGRLRRFYGNYFYPYWRDPFYYSMGMPFGYGYYGNPYSFYDPFYDPFYYDPYYFGGMYGGYYVGNYYGFSPLYYGNYYGFSPYFSSYYSPWYGNWSGYYTNLRYNNNDFGGVAYGRRERQSIYSTRWNSTVPVSSSARRENYVSRGTDSDASRRTYPGAPAGAANTGRTASAVNTRNALTDSDSKSGQDITRTQNASANTSRSTVVTRPEYNTVNRTYTPSYSNPRMSSRPSYNNTRVSGQSGSTYQNVNNYNNSRSTSGSGTGTVRTPSSSSGSSGTNRSSGSRSGSSPSVSAVQSRSYYSSPSYNSSGSYSVPSRRSVESGSGYSSGSFSSRSSSYGSSSSGSVSRSYSSGGGSTGSSYSGGSSSSSSGSSGGSSGGSSSSSSSSGGTTSSGRR